MLNSKQILKHHAVKPILKRVINNKQFEIATFQPIINKKTKTTNETIQYFNNDKLTNKIISISC